MYVCIPYHHEDKLKHFFDLTRTYWKYEVVNQPFMWSWFNKSVLFSFSLTLVDSLDTLVVMGDIEEFDRALRLVVRDVSFNNDVVVSVFETNIRMVGGLLSGHVLAEHLNQVKVICSRCIFYQWHYVWNLYIHNSLYDEFFPETEYCSLTPSSCMVPWVGIGESCSLWHGIWPHDSYQPSTPLQEFLMPRLVTDRRPHS